MAVVQVEKEFFDRLTALSKETHRPKTYYVNEALRRSLEDIEDLYLAIYRSETPSKTYTMQEVKKELALDY